MTILAVSGVCKLCAVMGTGNECSLHLKAAGSRLFMHVVKALEITQKSVLNILWQTYMSSMFLWNV